MTIVICYHPNSLVGSPFPLPCDRHRRDRDYASRTRIDRLVECNDLVAIQLVIVLRGSIDKLLTSWIAERAGYYNRVEIVEPVLCYDQRKMFDVDPQHYIPNDRAALRNALHGACKGSQDEMVRWLHQHKEIDNIWLDSYVGGYRQGRKILGS